MAAHSFYLGDTKENQDFDYSLFHEKEPNTLFPDNLFIYILDSLKWVPSFNPARRMQPQVGLNHFGVTVLTGQGSRMLQSISNAWLDLFTNAPQEMHLTGPFGWIEGQNPFSGSYENFVLDRDEVISNFDSLKYICALCAESNETKFIMHHGV